MNFDQAPFPLDSYRHMQRAIPGLEGFYRLVQALAETMIQPASTILIVGAGGGREIEIFSAKEMNHRLIAVDPSAGMLAQARLVAEESACADRVHFIEGTVTDVPASFLADAATSLLVMHFLPDDGEKLAYLRDIRARLKPGALFMLADVSFEDRAAFEAYTPVFIRHAVLAGLSAEQAALGPPLIAGMPIIGETRTQALVREAGFATLVPFFRGLWYTGWWTRAV